MGRYSATSLGQLSRRDGISRFILVSLQDCLGLTSTQQSNVLSEGRVKAHALVVENVGWTPIWAGVPTMPKVIQAAVFVWGTAGVGDRT